ncbi:DUF7003 family protein [Marininema halotolerans]|uniref:Uncharacterized protein n=1 Tax=Marininema halotolerans TaxID=1155944 RepID=A0A1I6ULX8_9BACL|nr:hypothetical protein [Marininema halotolerans]SFT02287.1 hypothetical protein SAMN05444972_1183 [Marininema halotolerans]
MSQFEEAANSFSFPNPDNFHIDMSQMRLSVFRDEQHWLITFEMVGYFIPSQIFINDLYAFGNCIEEVGPIQMFEFISDDKGSEFPFIDEEGKFIVSPVEEMCIKIWGEDISYLPNLNDYQKAGIDRESFSPTSFIRMVGYLYNNKLWLEDEDIFSALNLDKISLFYRTDSWNHEYEHPSKHGFFENLAKAIQIGDPDLIKNETPNTHWSNWSTDITDSDY